MAPPWHSLYTPFSYQNPWILSKETDPNCGIHISSPNTCKQSLSWWKQRERRNVNEENTKVHFLYFHAPTVTKTDSKSSRGYTPVYYCWKYQNRQQKNMIRAFFLLTWDLWASNCGLTKVTNAASSFMTSTTAGITCKKDSRSIRVPICQ